MMLISVAMLLADIDLAGLPGRTATGAANCDAGLAGMPEFKGCFCSGGGRAWIGVGAGVVCCEEDAVCGCVVGWVRLAICISAGRGFCIVGIGPVYGVPSS